jgi:hypothetical protein
MAREYVKLDIEGLRKYLGEIPKLKKKSMSVYADSQIIHDEKQVMDPSELEIGRVYELMNDKHGKRRSFGKIEIIALKFGKFGEIKVRHITNNFSYNGELFLTDCGLQPYGNGKWNRWNYLVPAEEENKRK